MSLALLYSVGDHPSGRTDGYDHPHMFDDMLDPSRLHKCVTLRVREGVTTPTDLVSSAGGECRDREV